MAPRLKFDVPQHLYPFEHRFVDLGNGIEMHYVDEGEGETLLMLHGNPTWSFLYRKMISRLRGDFRCVAPDYPGFGLTEAFPDHKTVLLDASHFWQEDAGEEAADAILEWMRE